MFFMLLLAANGVAVLAQDPSMNCPDGWTAFSSSCYAYVDHKVTWPDAKYSCAALGGFLVEILSDQENQFIQKMAQDHDHHTIWLGASDRLVEGTWNWAQSGVKVEEYTDWAPGQPDSVSSGDENCMEMNVDKFSSHWNNDQCFQEQRYICQKHMSSELVG